MGSASEGNLFDTVKDRSAPVVGDDSHLPHATLGRERRRKVQGLKEAGRERSAHLREQARARQQAEDEAKEVAARAAMQREREEKLSFDDAASLPARSPDNAGKDVDANVFRGGAMSVLMGQQKEYQHANTSEISSVDHTPSRIATAPTHSSGGRRDLRGSHSRTEAP